MFLLIGNDNTHYLLGDGNYTIGRHAGEIILKHPKISRKHAEILIENNEASIRDCDSTFFTKYNGKILLKNETVRLENGGVITLGELQLQFVIGENFITCSTGIKNSEEELRKTLKEIGGQYLKDWNDTCTHLTTPEIMVTLKVLNAIMDNKKIVTPEFWKAYSRNMKEKRAPPDPAEFHPPLGETMIHSSYLEYNPNRKCVFAGKTFAFWKRKRQSSMGNIISKAGGKTVLIQSKASNEEILKLMTYCIVMDPEDPDIEDNYSNLFSAYREQGKRIIPVQEIVLAILQCSCEEHCNPNFDRAKSVFIKEIKKPGTSKVVVEETENFQWESQEVSLTIPSSLENKKIPNIHNTKASADVRQLKKLEQRTSRSDVSKETEIVKEVREVTARKNPAAFFKRPALESLAPPPKKAKQDEGNLKLNPFSAMNSRMEARASTSREHRVLDIANNIFGQIRVKEPVKREFELDDIIVLNEDNPVPLDSKKRKSEDVIDSAISKKRTRIFSKNNRKFVEVATINFDELNHSISSGTWINKNIKKEVKPTISELGEDEQGWCERFNNSVVIVSKSLWRKNKENVSDFVSSSTQSNLKNFKKFRKVPPPKSGQIIRCSKAIYGNSNLSVEYPFSDDEDKRNM